MVESPEHVRLARSVSVTTLRLVAGALLGFFVTSYLARTLGPEINGRYSLVILFPIMAVAAGGLGIGPATVYFVGNGQFALPEIVAKNALLGLAAALATIAFGEIFLLIAAHRFFPALPFPLLSFALILALPLILFANLVSVFQGQQDFNRYSLFTLLPPLISAILLVLVLGVFTDKLAAAVSIWGMGYLGALFAVFFRLREHFKHFIINVRVRSGYFPKLLSYGLQSHLGNLLTLLNYRLDFYLLGGLSGTHAVGIYAVTVPITEAIWLLSNSVSTVVFPHVAAAQAKADVAANTTPFMAKWVLIITAAGAVFVGATSEYIIAGFFGAAYSEARLALMWLLPGVTLLAMARVLSNDIAGRGRPEVNLYISVASLIVNVTANIILIPMAGVIGAAMASSISYCLLTALVVGVYGQVAKVTVRSLLIPNRDDLRIFQLALSKKL